MSELFTDQEIAYIISTKEGKDFTWNEIADKYNKKFRKDRSPETIKQCYHRYKGLFDEDQYYLKTLREVHNTKKNNSIKSKENRVILDRLSHLESILDVTKMSCREIMKDLKKKRPVPKKKAKSGKKKMTKELLLSDIHFGKKTERFDLSVLKKRLQELTECVIQEMQRDLKEYDIHRLILAFLGDIIESDTMHGNESAKGCEFGNSRQIYEAQVCLFKILVRPILEFCEANNIVVDFYMVTGNHDRTEKQRTFNDPGEENVTYIIYNTIKDFVELAGFKNVSFDIPHVPWSIANIYGSNVLYEHYDNAANSERKALENLMTKRANQLSIIIEFMRGGHYHNTTSYDNGRIQINGSLPGNDSFSAILGFDSPAAQTFNSYVETKKRRSPFYRSFTILLEDVV
jgi:hypothetical protein